MFHSSLTECPQCKQAMEREWLLGRSQFDHGYAHICYFLKCKCGNKIKDCSHTDGDGGKCETSFEA